MINNMEARSTSTRTERSRAGMNYSVDWDGPGERDYDDYMPWWRGWWCWLFHRAYQRCEPVYHSWEVRCGKCKMRWIEND